MVVARLGQVFASRRGQPLGKCARAVGHKSVAGMILATAIAETSLTIEDIRVVIDTGLQRLARYDPATGMAYGQNGFGNGGSSQFCVLYPDRCASNVTVNVPQASVLVTNGYGSSTLQISAGGNAQTVPAGAPGTYGEPSGPPVDISEMQERLAAVEKKTNVMVPVLKKSVEVQCQQVLAHPEDIKDAKERELEVQSCTAKLKK